MRFKYFSVVESLLTAVVRVKRDSRGKLAVKVKADVCNGDQMCVKRIHLFEILNRTYFAVVRGSSLVQLYEQQRTLLASSTAYKLVKEWRNSSVGNDDAVVAMGSFRNQYMFTCSWGGKLVVRDLINDDADNSVNTYYIDGPVSCAAVLALQDNTRILIAAGGKNNPLKLYDLDFGKAESPIEHYCNRPSQGLGLSPRIDSWAAFSPFPLLSSRFLFGVELANFISHWKKLTPVFTASSKEEASKAADLWMSCIAFVNESTLVAGTHFGELLLYNKSDMGRPAKAFRLSLFSLATLHLFNRGRYLAYADSMSKVGVLDLESFKVVAFYDNLKLGPAVSTKIVTSPSSSTKLSANSSTGKFDPIFVMALSVEKVLVIYKLHDNGTKEMVFTMSNAGIMLDFAMMEANAYQTLETALGNEAPSCISTKRKKMGEAPGVLSTCSVSLAPLVEDDV